MAARMLVFDIDSLVSLIGHYAEGAVPRDAEGVAFAVSPILQRMLCLTLRSSQWPTADLVGPDGKLEPLIFRYEGNRVLKLERAREASFDSWGAPDAVEAPKRQ